MKKSYVWLITFFVLAFALAARFTLDPWLGSVLPFATFNLAVAVIAFCFGWVPALAASFVSILTGIYFFLEPRHSFAMNGPEQFIAAALSFAIMLAISLLGYAAQRSYRVVQESEEQFRRMAEDMPQLAWMARPDGYIHWYNRRWYEYTGTTPQLMEGWGWQVVHDPEILPKVLEQWKESIASGNQFEMVFPLRAKAGNFRLFLTRVFPLKDRHGHVVQWFGTNTDVEDLKKAEEDLRRQAAIIDLSPDAIMVRDSEANISLWSKGAERLYGWKSEEAVGQKTHDLLGTEFPEPLEGILEKLRAGHDWTGELVHKTKDGRRVVVQSFWHAEKIDSDWEFLESNVDVTERKRQQVSLQQSEEKFRAIFEQAGVGIGRVSLDDAKWIDVNEAFCRMLGYTPEEMRATPWPQMTHPDDVDLDLIPFRRMAAGELDSYSVEKRFLDKRGDPVWARLTLSLVRDLQGRPDYEIAIVEDITDRKHLENELRAAVTSSERAKNSAERANQSKDQFLAVLSHELRTPLAPVLAAVSLLRRRADLPVQVQDRLEIIQRNVSVEARLIDDLLDLTRIVRGKVLLDKVEVNVSEILDRVAEVCRPEIDAKQLHFGVMLEKPPYLIRADLSRIQQIFWNLINNSIKFTPAGGCVGIRAFQEDSRVIIEVTDSGIGIESETLPKIFDAFEQGGQGTTRQFGGLGLGLAITKRLVELHGGTISAKSKGANSGTIFRIALPAVTAESSLQNDSEAHAGAEKKEPNPPFLSKRILLVEDHADTAIMMKELLQVSGYEVETAADVEQSLQAIDRRQFDLLISDLGLPGRSGLELMMELRRRNQFIKGIALSGYGREEDIQRSREAGFSEHLTKPVDLHVLLTTLEKVI